ncbi:hypothetical protein NPIL_580481, partial [Nephila pilipes]
MPDPTIGLAVIFTATETGLMAENYTSSIGDTSSSLGRVCCQHRATHNAPTKAAANTSVQPICFTEALFWYISEDLERRSDYIGCPRWVLRVLCWLKSAWSQSYMSLCGYHIKKSLKGK